MISKWSVDLLIEDWFYAIANLFPVAPVTSWMLYDSVYTERQADLS